VRGRSTWPRTLVRSSSWAGGNFSVAGFCRVRGVCLVVGEHDEALPRGIVTPSAGVIRVAEPVVRGVRNHRNITGSGTPEKSHSAYPCEVAGGSSVGEPWDDSSSAEALGSLVAGTRRPGRTLRAAASVLAEVTYVVVAPRRPIGKRGPETERSSVGAVAISPVAASQCEVTCAARQRSLRARRERWPERRPRQGAEGPATSTWVDAGT
jgi:hypothetical protein